MDGMTLEAVLGNPWIQLLLGGIWQAIIVAVTWRWDQHSGRLLAMVTLAVFPVATLIVHGTNEICVRVSHLEELTENASKSSEIEAVFVRIGRENPDGLKRAQEIYAHSLVDLHAIASGRESIANETDYLAVLTDELQNTPDGAAIWDVVMPLNPSRVDHTGRLPLIRYLDRVKEAIASRRIVYNLVVMPSETDEEAVDKALRGFISRGVNLYVVNRNQMPPGLRDNFSFYEVSRVVCIPERGDDATILHGTRIRNDENEMITKRSRLTSILAHATLKK